MHAEENDFDGYEATPIDITDDEAPLMPTAPTPTPKPLDDEPISLVDEEPISLSETDDSSEAGSKIHAGAAGLGVEHKADFARTLLPDSSGATRCRFFHTKLLISSIEYMENQINEWIDSDDTIVVKHIGHVIGDMTGKLTEPNLIVCVWY